MRLIDADVLERNLMMMPDEELCEDCCYNVIKVLNKVPTIGGWISVKDRMPEDSRYVLVCNDDGKYMIAFYSKESIDWYYKYTNYDFDLWDVHEQGPVCYWMPLPTAPEPPKEVSGDE